MDRFFIWMVISGIPDLTYPHMDPVRALLGAGASDTLPDDEGEVIARAMRVLREEDAEAWELLNQVHGARKTLRWLESRGHGDRKRNGKVLAAAHSFIKGFMTACQPA